MINIKESIDTNLIDKYFKIAGDLSDNLNENDIENLEKNINIQQNKKEDIKNILLEIVSGEPLEKEQIIEKGSMIIFFASLEKMIKEDCYNFIKAEYFNTEMIFVEFEQY